MEAEEITKLVDGVYKNILEKFNPGARQLITAGKGYLKALHGSAAASRLFNEALAKIAMNAQQSGTNDIGAALMNVVSVYKEIQEQQMNILKAFYVDLLVPLETNLEKDTKVVQHEQKKFLQQHKVRMESYQKAVSTMKKQRKKKSSPENTEKELRSLQVLEDQKKKLDAFCEQSYKNALTQERRRYGFVLERQCSIAKHWMAYHSTGKNVIADNLENWQEIAASREIIPASAYENGFNGQKRMERLKDADDVCFGGGMASQLRKSRSIDAPYGDMRTLHETSANTNYTQNSLPRAKSDFNLNVSMTANDHVDHHSGHHWDQRPVVRALYAYMPSGENQLPFDEGDRIALVGSKAKGWQFGENLRTQMFGWFPIAYTNAEAAASTTTTEKHKHFERNDRYENMRYERNGSSGGGSGGGGMRSYQEQYDGHDLDANMESDSSYRRRNNSVEESSSPTRMFGDTINFRNQKKYRASAGINNPRPGPPPTLPAPVPSSNSQNINRMLNTSQSFCASNGGIGGGGGGATSAVERRKLKAMNGAQAAHSAMINQLTGVNNSSNGAGGNQLKPTAAAKTSLHSSNDSGFANEPPPQPEIDYSDEEQTSRVPIRRRADTNTHVGGGATPRDVASWTLNRNFRNSVDSQIDGERHTLNRQPSKMRYDLIASDDEILQASSGGIKRTKSFWKFGGGRGEDILAGMSLWQHRDLVAAPTLEEMRDSEAAYRKTSSEVEREREREDEQERELERNGTLTKSHNSSGSSMEKARRKDSITSMEIYDEDENIYGVGPLVREVKPLVVKHHQSHQQQQQPQQLQQQQQQLQQQQQQMTPPLHANFTPKSRMKIMKTIEIDIENPMDDEHLSTLKRNGQKEYNVRDMSIMPAVRNGHHGHRATEQLDSNNKANMQHRYPKQSSNEAKIKVQNGQNTRKSQVQQQQHQHQQQQQQTQPMMLQEMMLHSTEDEGGADSDDVDDDNGTLKMSDVHNFFQEHANGGGGIINGGGGGGGGLIMKTVKRKDILKQYYTSEDEEPESDEAEIKSTSSDPYDCIVINDHLVRKDEKLRRHHQHLNHDSYQEQRHHMEFQTFRATTTTGPIGSNNNNNNHNSNNVSTNGKKKGDLKSSKSGGSKSMQQQQKQQHDDMRNSNNNNNSNSSSTTLTRNTTNGNSSMMHTPTATILPRTRLMKSSNTTTMTLERTQPQHKAPRENGSGGSGGSGSGLGGMGMGLGLGGSKTYGPWYDFWDQQDQQQTLVNQKSMNSKMK